MPNVWFKEVVFFSSKLEFKYTYKHFEEIYSFSKIFSLRQDVFFRKDN